MKKSIILTILIIVLALSMISVPVYADPYFVGEGTEANPFIINSQENLVQFADLVNSGNPTYRSAFFKMTSDVYLTSYANWNPIGNVTNSFDGNFDGNSYSVKGINLVADGTALHYGLFGYNTGVIRNLGVSDGTLTVSGGAVGFMPVLGSIVGTNTGRIENCFNKCDITGNTWVHCGGIAGANKGQITYCYNTGKIEARSEYIDYATIPGYAGGIVAENPTGGVTYCYNTGSVSGWVAGGIARGYGGSISNCYNTGSVFGHEYGGGIVGFSNGWINCCYNIGPVRATRNAPGAICGGTGNGDGFGTCYFLDMRPVGGSYSGTWPSLKSCTMEQMQQAATYIGFQFPNVWKMPVEGINSNCPVLNTVGDGSIHSIEVVRPNKTTYKYGDPLDVQGGQLLVTTSAGSKASVNITADMVSGFSSTTLGKQSLSVSYWGQNASFDIIVIDYISSISIKTFPKQNYLFGEVLNVDGGAISVNMASGTKHDILLTPLMVSGFDSSVLGAQSLTVEYEGFRTTYNISVNDYVMDISIVTPPKLVYIVGELLDVSSGIILANYASGASANIAMSVDMVTGFSNAVTGYQTLAINFSGRSTSYQILVCGPNDIIKMISPTNSDFVYDSTDITISASIPINQKSVTLNLEVSPGASWAIYNNPNLKKQVSPEISFKKSADVTVYIKVTAADETTYKVYTMTITKG